MATPVGKVLSVNVGGVREFPRPPQGIEPAYHRLMASDPANLLKAADLHPLLMPPYAAVHQAPRTGRACQ